MIRWTVPTPPDGCLDCVRLAQAQALETGRSYVVVRPHAGTADPTPGVLYFYVDREDAQPDDLVHEVARVTPE